MSKNTNETPVAEKEYSAEIIASNKELSAKERLILKDTTACKQLDDLVQMGGEKLLIAPETFAQIRVHNEKSKDKKDYDKLVIVDKNGERYVTGSDSFMRTFFDIDEEMAGEDYEILVFKKESKNYAGKGFLTCTVNY